MSDLLTDARIAAARWARYAGGSVVRAGHRTPEARLMDEASRASSAPGAQYQDPVARQVERIVLELEGVHRAVLIEHYAGDRRLDVEERARRCGLASRQQYHARLREALAYLAGRLKCSGALPGPTHAA